LLLLLQLLLLLLFELLLLLVRTLLRQHLLLLLSNPTPSSLPPSSSSTHPLHLSCPRIKQSNLLLDEMLLGLRKVHHSLQIHTQDLPMWVSDWREVQVFLPQ